jgi:uncharacterized protein
MAAVSFRFYARLNDFVSIDRRGRRFEHLVRGRSSVKDAIEALGVPHPEVDLIVVNGNAVGFGYPLQDGDTVAVYPAFCSLDLGDLPRVGAAVPEPIRFVADIHLRKLASYLRLAGFDAIVLADDVELAEAAERDARVLLTRDRELLKRNAVHAGCYVRNTDPRAQFVELVERFALASRARPFTRCLCCNGVLRAVSAEAIADRLPPRTRAAFDQFHLCEVCGRAYWRGSHYARLETLLRQSLGEPPLEPGAGSAER